MRPEFTEHKVLAAADLEDERAYLQDAHARHLERVHGTTGEVLVAAQVTNPDGPTTMGLGSGPAGTALTVGTATGGRPSDHVRVTAPAAQRAPAQLIFSRMAAAPATGPAPGTLSLLAGVGSPAGTELRIEGRGGGSGPALRAGPVATGLSIDAGGTVTVGDLTVTGKLAMGPAPAPAGTPTPDPTGSVAAAEALRRQLAAGVGIGADVGIGVAFASASVASGRVRFTVEVTGEPGVAPLGITIKGRVNVGTTVVADDLALLPAQLQAGQILRRAIDLPIPAAASGDVIAAVTAYGVHPQRGLVNASEARLLGTV